MKECQPGWASGTKGLSKIPPPPELCQKEGLTPQLLREALGSSAHLLAGVGGKASADPTRQLQGAPTPNRPGCAQAGALSASQFSGP